MSAADDTLGVDRVDTWRRLLWELPVAALSWLVLLAAFGLLVGGSRGRDDEKVVPLDARLLDVPASVVGGLQGGGGPGPPPPDAPVAQAPAEAAPPPPPAEVKPKPEAKKPPLPSVPSEVKRSKTASPPVNVKQHAVKAMTEVPENAGTESGAGGSAPSLAAGSGTGGGGGVGGPGTGGGGGGSSSVGAQALFAPPPEVPDDLREDVFETEALARFHVDDDGHTTVTLVKATSNPRLNRILLDSLKQWRFAPAVKAGIKVDSEFDVRIPIAVR